jgi:hypothetical protein
MGSYLSSMVAREYTTGGDVSPGAKNLNGQDETADPI